MTRNKVGQNKDNQAGIVHLQPLRMGGESVCMCVCARAHKLLRRPVGQQSVPLTDHAPSRQAACPSYLQPSVLSKVKLERLGLHVVVGVLQVHVRLMPDERFLQVGARGMRRAHQSCNGGPIRSCNREEQDGHCLARRD